MFIASDTAGAPPQQRAVLPMLRVVGQLNATYVICEGPDGMYLLDQHAAHERVVYDRLVAAPRVPGGNVQPLLEPLVLELEAGLAATLHEHRESLARLGLETEPFGDNAALIRSAPAGLGARDLIEEVRALLQKLENEQRVDDLFGKAAATVACHASVRAGMLLSMEEMRRLVEDLERTPHQTIGDMNRDTLRKSKGRDNADPAALLDRTTHRNHKIRPGRCQCNRKNPNQYGAIYNKIMHDNAAPYFFPVPG